MTARFGQTEGRFRAMGKGRVYPYLLIAPAQLLLALSILVPAIYVAWLSLHSSSYGQQPLYVGAENYGRLLSDPSFWAAFVNTVFIVNVIVYVELLIGIAVAALLWSGVPFPKIIMSILLLPYAVSEVAASVMWKYMLEPQAGVVQWLLTSLGLPTIEWTTDPWQGLTVIGLMAVWHHLPFTILVLYAALLNIPNELYEAATLDGASKWQEFRRITIPLLMPAILVALLFRYIFAFRIFSEVWLMTQGGPARTTEVLAIYLYSTAFRYDEFGLASATGWLMMVLSLLIAIPYLFLTYRRMRTDAA
jgi:multiple sugar transport system permease protein